MSRKNRSQVTSAPQGVLGKLTVTCLSLASLSLVTPQIARADSGTWTGATSGQWANTANWSGITTTVPGTGNTATFNGASGNTTIDLDAGVTIGSVLFDTSSAAAYTIGSGAVGNQTLTLGTVGGGITINAGVTTAQLFNSNLALATSTTANNASTYYKLTNNSATNTLTVAGGISASTTGTKTLQVNGSGNTVISGAISSSGSNNVSLFKTGSGTLTLSGGATWAGNGTTDGANFSSSAVFREGTTILNGNTYSNSGGELVVGGVATNGGAGTDTTLQLQNGATLNNISWLSIGRGNGNGTATSNLTLNDASISATNFSAGFNAGNTGNTPKGTITLNGESSLSITTEFHLGESAGSDFAMTLNDSSSVTVGSGTIYVGRQNGKGTLNVNTGTTFTTNGEIRVAFSEQNGTFNGTGTINVDGGTVSTRALTVGRNNNDATSTMAGTVNVTAGALNVRDQTSLIGWRGVGVTGTVNISGGSYNQGTTSASNMVIGSFTGVTGAVNVSSTGALTFQNNSNLQFSNVAGANATGTLTISGGNVAFYSDAGTTVGGTGVIDLMNSTGTGTNTINLDGGTLAANQIKATNATGTRVINFNGGTLRSGAGALASTFLNANVATTANVRDGGAIIDTNGNAVTIGQALTHSAIGGDNAIDGGLTKNGTGTLTLSGANTYTGVTTVSTGTLALASTGSLTSTTLSVASTATFDVVAKGGYSLASNAITLSLDGSSIGLINAGAFAVDFSGAALTLNLTTGTPGASYDYLTSTATGNLASVTLAGSFSGTLGRSGNIWTGTSSGYSFSLDQTSGALNITAVPEPHEFALAIVGLLGVMIFIRRRNQQA